MQENSPTQSKASLIKESKHEAWRRVMASRAAYSYQEKGME